MGIEDQREEREVLSSIFPDEITDISETAYRISITLDIPESSNPEAIPAPVLMLNVAYPENYPDVGPNLDISSAPNASKHPLLDVAEDKPQLLEGLEPTIEECLGMAMVFTLVSALKESAENLIIERRRQSDSVREAEKRKVEEEENRKFTGTAVTRDRFVEWRQKFRKEAEERAKKEKEDEELAANKGRTMAAGTGAGKDEKKLTGRQLWEKGLVGKDEDLAAVEGDGVDGLANATEKVKVSG